MSIYTTVGMAAATLLALSGTAQASDTKFDYVKAEGAENGEKKATVEWKATAQAGLLMTTGNSTATTISSGFKASRKAGQNRVQLELDGAFARSTIYLANDDNENDVIDENELTRITKTSSKNWRAKIRYDRFLSPHNAVYTSAALSADEPAGKELIGTAQVGYSRIVVDTKVHQLTLESGYDFSYEDLSGSAKSVSIHSWRVFAGYQGKLSAGTSLEISTESLFNLNELQTSSGPVGELDDTRLNNQVSLTTSIYGDLSFRFSFQSKFDNNPAPRPKLSLPYATSFAPLADKLDTRTEAAIIVNFL
ncbi:MAG: DUF481 domain-containing protein [Myxococcales bacterium]|nr:DUF481 domain-containing protein [Myxococcales bacterium]